MDLHSGRPFWPIRNGVPAAYAPLRTDLRTEVAVIGAGVTGALIAYELATAGVSVAVLDRDEVVSGSSAATSGLLLYDTDLSFSELAARFGPATAARVYALGLGAIDHVDELCRTIGAPCGFSRRPSLYLASRRRHVAALREEFEHRAALGFDVTFLERPDVEARYGFEAPAAISSRGTAEIDCHRFSHALLAAARGRGAHIHGQTKVLTVTSSPSGVILTTAEGCRIDARGAVYATGYDTGLPQPSDARYQLASTWVVVTEPLGAFTGWDDRSLIWETARPYVYLRTTDDGRLLIGGEDEPQPERHREPSVLSKKVARLLGRARRMFPRLRLEEAYAWAGTFATTEDGLPYIGELATHPGVWMALGYGGNGITFAVIAARLIRDAFAGHANADANLFGLPRRPLTDIGIALAHSERRHGERTGLLP